MTSQPTGTVTMLFSDIEGSTRLLAQLGTHEYARILEVHRRLLRTAFEAHDGYEVGTEGDSFFVAFQRADGAVAAAAAAQRALANAQWPEGAPIRVRMGIHTGEPMSAGANYVGMDVHRAARIMSAAHGNQVLLSQAAADIVDAEVRDLGLHRLKDLSSAERLFQLGTEDFPPLRTLHHTNLPAPATPFLGREPETTQVADLIRRSDVRLVTLTGPGGSGKTRLALQAAAAASDTFKDGIWWVPLAAFSDSSLVETAAAHVLGSTETLAAAVADKRLLLLFDNFEHLLDAVTGLAETLASCPNLTVLVTSREPLHVDGEWEFAVEPMQEREAVELFNERAAAVHSGFAATDEVALICRRLDFLPLAIELAAARVKALSLPALLERLERRLPLLASGSRSAPVRQRTLRATIAWSHDLLAPSEQDAFARLAVFADGGTLAAIEEVCGAELDVIASLVDKSLVRRSDDHYWMLETIREYADEQLAGLADAELLRDRHAAWYLALAERAHLAFRTPREREWFDRLGAEHANLRAALEHLLMRGDPEAALRLSGAIWSYWESRGHWTEGRRLLAAALALGAGAEPAQLTGPLWGAAILAVWQGDLAEGERLATRLLQISREAELPYAEAVGLQTLGIVADDRGESDLARALYEESLQLARTINDPWLLSVATNNLGSLYSVQNEYERASQLFEESLLIGEAQGDLDRRARALSNLGYARRGLGDVAGALDHFRRSLTTATEIGLIIAQINAMHGISCYRAELGDAAEAARLTGWTNEQRVQLGSPIRPEDIELEKKLRDRLGPERLAAELARGGALTQAEAIELALETRDGSIAT